MRNFDLPIFLNTFFYKSRANQIWLLKKIWLHLQIIYGINFYTSKQLCIIFGINEYIETRSLHVFEWENIYIYICKYLNFKLFDLKNFNVKQIRLTKTYKGWRHIFSLPTRGQRSHTNAKTRKKYKIT